MRRRLLLRPFEWLLGLACLLGASATFVVPDVERSILDDVQERLEEAQLPAEILVVGRDVTITVDDQIGQLRAIDALQDLDRVHHLDVEIDGQEDQPQ